MTASKKIDGRTNPCLELELGTGAMFIAPPIELPKMTSTGSTKYDLAVGRLLDDSVWSTTCPPIVGTGTFMGGSADLSATGILLMREKLEEPVDFPKPMLACTAKSVDSIPDKVFPLMVSAKLDGVRVRFTEEGLKFRSGKLVPNVFLQKMASVTGGILRGVEAEIIVGPPNLSTTFSTTSSFVRSKNATCEYDRSNSVTFYCFDTVNCTEGASSRTSFILDKLDILVAVAANRSNVFYTNVRQKLIHSKLELQEVYKDYLDAGFEGLIACSTKSKYKHGRSTLSKGELIKLKPKGDSEGRIIGYTDQVDKNGKLTGVVGCLILMSDDFTSPVKVSSGLTDKGRKVFQDCRNSCWK